MLTELGLPVVIVAKDESVLHGAETLQAIIKTGIRLDTLVIRGVERQEFEGSDLPEICVRANGLARHSFPTLSA